MLIGSKGFPISIKLAKREPLAITDNGIIWVELNSLLKGKECLLVSFCIEVSVAYYLMVRSFSERFWKFSTEAGHTNRTKSPTGIRCAVVRLTKE